MVDDSNYNENLRLRAIMAADIGKHLVAKSRMLGEQTRQLIIQLKLYQQRRSKS
jgi:hypothetical protein